MEDEYQVSDDLTQENENPQEVRGDNIWPVRSVPPISVALPAQSPWLGAPQSGASSTENSNGENRDKQKRPEDRPPYRCRFCQQTFSKSQALGGHMNRHRQERHVEKYDHAIDFVHAHPKGAPYSPNFYNVGPPSQIQPQFPGTPTVGPWPGPPVLTSQFSGVQPQQGAFNHTQHPFRSNLGHPQGNSYADSNALNIGNRQLHTNILNIQSNSPGWNRPDMVPTTGDDRNQDSQPRQQPPQVVLRSDGFGANMQRNYPLFGPGTLSSASPPVAVREGDQFSPSFQSPRHDNLRIGTSDQSGGLLSNSAAHQIEHSSSLNFTLPPFTSQHSANQQEPLYSHVLAMQDFQNMQLPTYLSIQNPTPPTVHEDSRLPNVSGILTGLTPHYDPNSGVGSTLQMNYPYSFGHGMPSSLSSTVDVTQRRFNPIIQRQNPTPTINSPVNEYSRLANVSATFRGLTQPFQFQAATRINSQEDINLVAGESHSDNAMINSDLPLISNPYMYGSTSGRD